MKKIQMPIILPILMGTAIAVLTGVLLYSAFNQDGEIAEQPQVIENTIAAETDAPSLLGRLKTARNKLALTDTAKGELLKGRYLLEAVGELETASVYCGEAEKNLRRFITSASESLRQIGDRQVSGGALTEADSNNIKELAGALDSTISTVERAVDENNNDYLRGEFTPPAMQLTDGNAVSREKATEAAAVAAEDVAFNEEKDYYYSFSNGSYVLEVAKADGSLMYRRVGYESVPAELTAERLTELTSSAKSLLKNKGFGDMVLMEWQAYGGELALGLYPLSGDTVYLNAPFTVVLGIGDGSLLGLRTSAWTAAEIPDNDELLQKLRDEYKENNYIIKAVSEYGAPCYLVSFGADGTEYLSLWQIVTEQETELSKIENNTRGRLITKL